MFGQNISVNTSGAIAASNMFEVTQISTAANMVVAIYAIHSGASAGTGYGLYCLKGRQHNKPINQ